MKRRVKEFVDIADHVSLDDLIEKLAEVRASLPDESEAELRLRGDEVFGHRITISYLARADRRGSGGREALRRSSAGGEGARARATSGRAGGGLLRSAGQARKAADRGLSGIRPGGSSAPGRSCNSAGRSASAHRRTHARGGRRSARTAPRSAPSSGCGRRA